MAQAEPVKETGAKKETGSKETGPAKEQGPVPPAKLPAVIKPSLVDENKFGADYKDSEKDLPALKKWQEHALKSVFRQNPKLEEVYRREGLQVFVVDNVQHAAALIGQDVGAGLDAVTLTMGVAKGGDLDQVRAVANFIFIDKKVYGNYAKLVTILNHELHHCTQTTNPAKGEKMVPLKYENGEIDALTKGIKDMREIQKSWEEAGAKDPQWKKFSEQMLEQLKVEQGLLDLFTKKQKK